MTAEEFTTALGVDFYTGVPDSQLKALCDYLVETYGTDPRHHVIAANEGNCTALAAGYHLATGKTPVVYLQNSGIGNIINPVASLLNEKIYGIPCLFVVGWRGEPGVHDEPQHVYQGRVTLKLLEDMGISAFVLEKGTSREALDAALKRFFPLLAAGKQAAIVVRKGALTHEQPMEYKNDASIVREDAIRHILAVTGKDPVVSTTGKISRELYELRESIYDGHEKDFLTVGSMGHASSISLGIALQKPHVRVWCIDGDGAALMHMGAMAVIGFSSPANMVHVVINNEAHESVGGMPTAARVVSMSKVARACGYKNVYCVGSEIELKNAMEEVTVKNGPSFIEILCTIGSRADLGRPTMTPLENKLAFMRSLNNR